MKISPADLPGASKLNCDYIARAESLQPFYRVPYDQDSAIVEHARALANRTYPFTQLADILEKQNRHFGACDKTMAQLEQLKSGSARVVITGQQTGVFGGPMYVLYKALTTIKLADRWSRLHKIPFVPVFWLAADDSDFEEINHITFLNKQFENQKLAIEKSVSGNVPVSDIPLGAGIDELLASFADSVRESEYLQEIMQHVQAAYTSQRSVSGAFGHWLMHCLKEFGIILIDPTDPQIRNFLSDIWVREIEQESPSTQAVLQTSDALEKSGYALQVPLRAGRLNLFYLDGERKPLEIIDSGFQTTDGEQQFSKVQLLELARNHPERFSPNVILRAITQDTLFPTVAYVAGPAEVGYFAQLKGVYEAFEVPMPAIYPRKSLTIIEPTVDRIMDKHSLTMQDAWGNIESKITELARQRLPETLTKQVTAMKARWPEALHGLQDDIEQLDPTLLKMLDNTAGRIASTIDAFEKKMVQAAKRQDDISRQQLYKVAAALYPNQSLQERVHNFTPYLIKYGPLIIERIYEILDISSTRHQIVRL